MPGRALKAGFWVLLAAVGSAAVSAAATLARFPYVQNMGADRASILWVTLEPGAGAVEYSSEGGSLRSASAQMREFRDSETNLGYRIYQFRADLTGLRPDTEYTYRVRVDGEQLAAGETLRFRTAGNTAFRFLAFGDNGQATREQRELATRMIAERANLVVHTGDLAYPNGTFREFQTGYFDIYKDFMKSVPFFPSPGNHEYHVPGAAAYLAVHAVPTSGVPPADHGRYYSFEWSNAHFVALDTNAPMEEAVRGRGAMFQWLAEDLRRARQFWRVVYFHHPAYAFDRRDINLEAPAVRRHIVPILEESGVPLVLNGHEHNYQRSHPIRAGAVVPAGEGTVHVVTGGGGAGLYSVAPLPVTAASVSVHHYVRADVDGYRMVLRAIGIDGSEIDSLTLAPPPLVLPDGVVNTASYTPDLAPGGLVTIFGRQMAATERQGTTRPLPTELAGVIVTLDGEPLPLLYVSATQINAQLPFRAGGRATLRVTTPNGSSEVQITIARTAPAIFANAVTHSTGEPVSAAAPARPGDWLTAYATGLGGVNGQIAPGMPAPVPPLEASTPVTVRLGTVAMQPLFAGLTPGYWGLYQVNFRVPVRMAEGIYPLRIIAGEVTSNAVNVVLDGEEEKQQ